MTVGQLKEMLEDFSDDLEIKMACQPNYPLQSTIAGIAGDFPDDDDEDDRTEPDCLYIVEGRQTGYAHKSLWDNL